MEKLAGQNTQSDANIAENIFRSVVLVEVQVNVVRVTQDCSDHIVDLTDI